MAAVCSPGQWCYLAWRLREHSTWTQTAKVCRHSWSNVSNLPWGGPFIRPLHALHAGWGNRSHNNILKSFVVDLAKRWCLMSHKKRASSVYLRQLQLWCYCNKMIKTLSTNHLVLPSICYLSFNVCSLAIISSDYITSMTPHCPLEIVMCLRKKNNWSRILSVSTFGSELLTGICEILFLRCCISKVYLLKDAFPLTLQHGYRNRHLLPLFLPLISRCFQLLL